MRFDEHSLVVLPLQHMNDDLKLAKSPLVDAIVELRFENTVPSQVLAGLLFNKLQSMNYTEFEELPIMQLPPALREREEGLKYAAHYRIKSEKFWVTVGATIVSVVAICKDNSYPGWDEYKSEIDRVLAQLTSIEMITNLTRLNVRYVNLFDGQNINDNVQLTLNTPFEDKVTDEVTFNFTVKDDDSSTQIIYSSIATISNDEGATYKGSLLDLNWYYDSSYGFDEIDDLIIKGHSKVESLFISTLKPDFLEGLK